MLDRLTDVVIGDVHARTDLLRSLLAAVGALDSRGRRRGGFWIVQLGDLLDRRASREDNLRAARLAVETLDVVLAGNHELDMLAGREGRHGPALATLAGRGWPQAAAEVGGWLVSHAGVHPGLTHGLPEAPGECAAEINDRWYRRSAHRMGDPLFDWVGPARGGVSPYGGLFWGSASEWPPDGRTPWGQICGHVPQPRPRLEPGPRWLIDVGADGARLAAVVRRPNADAWEPLTVQISPRGMALRGRSAKRIAVRSG